MDSYAFAVFTISILVQLSYWFFFYVNFRIIKAKYTPVEKRSAPLSIIVCYKNEAANLPKTIPLIVAQLQKQDELILVDDFSTDDSCLIAKQLTRDHDQCHNIRASFDAPGKKQALTDGVSFASNQYILVTDADCSVPLNWRTQISFHLHKQTDFILGYAPFFQKKGLLNMFQRYECLLTATQYFSYANTGLPYMGVGRNLLFKKAIFDPQIYDDSIASGDDDLLVGAKATKINTSIMIHPDSFVYSEAKKTLTSYILQKLRHISTAPAYRFKVKVLLSLFSSSHLIVYALGAYLLFTPYWLMTLIVFLARMTIVTLTIYQAGKCLKEEKLFLHSLLLDALLTVYYLILTFIYPFKKKSAWN